MIRKISGYTTWVRNMEIPPCGWGMCGSEGVGAC